MKAFIPEADKFPGGPVYCEPEWSTETELLLDFFKALDEAGLPIPGDSGRMRQRIQYGLVKSPFEHEIQPLIALAQHHGLPTRLLDWTHFAKYAAYFAASDALSATLGQGTLDVWALRVGTQSRPAVFTAAPWTVTTREFARADNQNLHAQAGLFTVAISGYADVQSTDSPMPLDKIVEDHGRTKGLGEPLMRRLSLPHCRAPDLLRELSYEPVHAALMFPNESGVVRRIREMRTWIATSRQRRAP